jgi:hypothetical protein
MPQASAHRFDESSPVYPSAVCSPALTASVSTGEVKIIKILRVVKLNKW